MKKLVMAFVYTALLTGANGSFAAGADIATLRTGDMKKLVVHGTPEATSTAPFELADDAGQATLADTKANMCWSISGPHGARRAAKKCQSLTRCKSNWAGMILRS